MSIASTNLSDTANLARLDASNSFSVINPITTLSESWIGPSSSTGIYFKGGNVGIGTVNPSQSFDVSGNAVVSGALGVGNNSIPGSLSLINRPNIFSPVLGSSQTIETVSGSHFGVSGYILLNGNTNVGGLLGMIEIPSTNSNITSTVKGSFSAVNNYGTGTASSVNGSWSSVDNYGIGTITDARGADISVYNDDNGNITKGLGASIGIDNYGNGNITNSTGNSIYAYNEGSGTITTNKGIESFSNNYGTGTISTNYGYYDEITNASTALISSAWGVSNNILNTGRGTITTARGYGMRFQNTTGSTIGTLYGFSAGGLNDVWSNAGTINTSYGIYLGSSIDVGITKYAIYSASVSNSYYAGNIGIGTSSPANILSLGGTAPRTIWMERNTTAGTAGQGLTLSSGGAIAGTANLVGGDLTLKSGISTGTGSSSIHLFTDTAGSTGTADNATTEKMTILGSGYVGIGASSPSTKLEIGSSDLGNGIAGPVLTLGRNTNATNAGAGSINFLKKDGTSGYVWQDAAGNMRINTSAPITTNDTAGTVIGAQTSTRNTKQDITDYTDYDAALSMVTNAPLHKFRYINEVNGYGSDSPLAKTRIGFIADEVDPAFMVGNVIDQVSVNGILMASIKDLDLKVKNISLNDPSLSLNLNIKNILAEISNNIIDLYAKVIHSDKVETKMLCVGSTCVTEQQFLEIVNKNTPVPTPTTETTTPVPTPTTETTTPVPTPTTETTTPVPTPTTETTTI